VNELEILDIHLGRAIATTSTLVILEGQRRKWRCYEVGAIDQEPTLTERTELIALACQLREASRGHGEAPVSAAMGVSIAHATAKTLGKRIHCQIIGAAETFKGWVEA